MSADLGEGDDVNDDRDSISVVIPTLNAGATIERLLSILERQSVEPKEIIVIDSSSDDGTVEIARSHPGVQTGSSSFSVVWLSLPDRLGGLAVGALS